MLHTRDTIFFFFFFNDTATTEIYTLSLHDALPIYLRRSADRRGAHRERRGAGRCEAGPAGARVLALEGDFSRSGDPEREGHLLCAGSPAVGRSHGASEPVRGRTRDPCGTWTRLRATGGSLAASGFGGPAFGGARVDPGEPGNAVRAGGAPAGAEAGAGSAACPPGARETRDPVPTRAGSRVLERSGWIHAGRPRIRHGSGQRDVDAGSMDQRGGEPGIRIPGFRVGLR